MDAFHRSRLYIYLHHSLSLYLLFSFYLVIRSIEYLDIFHWKKSLLISKPSSEESLTEQLEYLQSLLDILS